MDRTPFYAESGGQVGDIGEIVFEGKHLKVIDTQKQKDLIVHKVADEIFCNVGNIVQARVDKNRRFNIMRNHTSTHLLHEALRITLGDHVYQQGSLVAPDRLRFDFNYSGKITPEQIRGIEDLVNEKIAEALPVNAPNDPKEWLTIEEAKKRYPKVKMFFGEKYGDKVRVVEVKNFTWELCGGTHVTNTKDIQFFKIISESSIASGIRRIEAVTGEGLVQHVKKMIEKANEMDVRIEGLLLEKEKLEKQLSQPLKVELSDRSSLGVIQYPTNVTIKAVDDIDRAIKDRETIIEEISNSISNLRKQLGKSRIKKIYSEIETLVANPQIVDGIKVVSGKVDVQNIKELQSLGDALRLKLGSGVGVLGAVIDDKVSLVCIVTDDIVKIKKLQAGKIVNEVAKFVGGKGGGRPNLATAGGQDIEKIDYALDKVGIIVKNLMI